MSSCSVFLKDFCGGKLLKTTNNYLQYMTFSKKNVHAVEEILHKIKDNFLRIKVIRGYIDFFFID